MKDAFFAIYLRFFCKPIFARFHKALVIWGMKGLGILNYQNHFLTGERHFISKVLSRMSPKVIFDVGANEGKYIQMLQEYIDFDSLHAFEPHPDTFQRLKNQIKGDNISFHNMGMSDHKGMLTLFDIGDKEGTPKASLFKEVVANHSENSSRTVNEIDISLSTLDEYCDENGIEQIDFLKVDTEGHELSVLIGAKQMIDSGRINVIQFEFDQMNTVSKVFFKDFYELLENYDVYRLMPDSMLKIEKYHSITCEVFAFQNIVAIRKK
ncbi:FkbM family methyltransferase [Aureibacter tunicatorum]|uniref:FkbM family methyltransferase n=1 Tax=Aureibacter tunicatorum TaxID=866807 RepID=A0AAE3XNC4_9BACT|nr:FkbM family methyltransferase [Aureibacter tunicatorum]MDR6239054.1 FkbM family methyltransferase [Aureibacter tunicatorum]BDD05020.1 methyltransferase FkbM [Aureibacter tunicatorum]